MKHDARKHLRANLLMLAAAAIWGSAFVAQRLSLAVIGPFLFTGLRFLLGAAVLVPLLCANGAARAHCATLARERTRLLPGLALGGLLAVSISLQQIGLQYTKIANAGFISSLYVVLVPVIGVFFRHRTGIGTWLGALLAAIGLYFLSVDAHFSMLYGDWFQLAGAIVIAFHVIAVGHLVRRHDPLVLSFMQFVVCGALCLALGLAIEPRDAHARAADTAVRRAAVGRRRLYAAGRRATRRRARARGRDLQHGRRVRRDRRLGRARRDAVAARARGLRADDRRAPRLPVAARPRAARERQRACRLTRAKRRTRVWPPSGPYNVDSPVITISLKGNTVIPSAEPAAALLRERAARYAAEVALFVRDHALSVASHDLRSPLNAMHSWAYVLERRLTASDENLARALDGIRIGIEQQTKLLETTIDAPRAETRSLPIARAGVALDALADECAALARIALGDARGTAVTIASPMRPASLECDRERVAQALWSMLTFAIEASAPGGEVALGCDGPADAARLNVTFLARLPALTDTTLPHVFETFARREALAERQGERPAAVFALAQRVARAHGGAFAQEPNPLADGARATLALTIPAARA